MSSDQGATQRRIARNTIYLTTAFAIQKLLSFLYFAYYSGVLGDVVTGRVFTAITFATAFGVFIDAGFSPVLIRETARQPERAQRILSNVLWFKAGFSVVAYVLLVTLVNMTNYAPITRELAAIVGLGVILESFTLSIFGVFRGFQDLRYEAIGSVLFQIVVFIIGGIAVHQGYSVLLLGVALLFGALTNFLFAVTMLRRRLKLRLLFNFDSEIIAPLLKIWIPFFVAAVLIRAYSSIDIILLSLLRNEQSVGWYSVAYKLTFALQFLPIALNNSIFPAFSRAFVTSQETLRAIFEQSYKFLLVLAVPLTAGIAIFVNPILQLRWASFHQTPPALTVLILGLPFIFANLILGSLLNATNRQRENTIHIGLTLVANIIADLILIPHLGHVGAAWGSVISSIVFFLLSLRWVPRLSGMTLRRLVWMTCQAFAAAIPLVLLFLWVRQTGWVGAPSFFLKLIKLVVLGGIGAIVYTLTALVTGAISRHGILDAWRSIRSHG